MSVYLCIVQIINLKFILQLPGLKICRTQTCRVIEASDTYMLQHSIPTLVQIMACRLYSVKPLSKPMLPYCQLDPEEHISVKFYLKFKTFHSWKCIWEYRLLNGRHFVQGEMSLSFKGRQWFCTMFSGLADKIITFYQVLQNLMAHQGSKYKNSYSE